MNPPAESITSPRSSSAASQASGPIASPTRGVAPRDAQAERAFRSRINRRERQLVWQVGPVGWLAIDSGVAVLSVLLAYWLSPFAEVLAIDPESLPYLTCCIGFTICLGIVANVAGMHDARMPRVLLDLVGRSCLVVGMAMLVFGLLIHLVYYAQVGRYISGYICLFGTVGMIGTRVLVWKMSDTFSQRLTFVGDDKFRFDANSFLEHHEMPLRRIVPIEYDEAESKMPLDIWALSYDIDEIVYDSQSGRQYEESLLRCLEEGIKITSYVDFIEDNYLLVPVERIDAQWLLGASVEVAHPYYNGIKRLLDVVIASAGLLLTSPFLLVAMLLVRLESKGPSLYSQDRVGRFQQHFRIYKLRSMVQNAETNGAQWAAAADARVTRVGRFLRFTRLDEIPQFWNVLRGDMSLVGPRPERPEFVELLSAQIPFYSHRHVVKPGLTGWAQINYPYGASIEDANNKLKYDLYYMKRASLLLDLQIGLRTLGAMMRGSR